MSGRSALTIYWPNSAGPLLTPRVGCMSCHELLFPNLSRSMVRYPSAADAFINDFASCQGKQAMPMRRVALAFTLLVFIGTLVMWHVAPSKPRSTELNAELEH